MNRIGVRILSAIVVSVLIVGVTIGVLSLERASDILQEESYEKFEFISRDYANEISIVLAGVESTVNTLSSDIIVSYSYGQFTTDSSYRDGFMSNYGKSIKGIGQMNPNIHSIYVMMNPEMTNSVYEMKYGAIESGEFVYQEAEALLDIRPDNDAMAWYYNPIKEGKGVWSLPFYSKSANQNLIAYTKAMYSDQNLIGVVGVDIAFDEIIETIEEMVFYEQGYAILLDHASNIIIHPEIPVGTNLKDVENEDLGVLVDRFEESEKGYDLYTYKGQEKIMGFSRLSNDWIFMVVTTVDEIHHPVIMLRRYIFIIVMVMVLISTIIGIKMTISITGPLKQLHKLTEQIGEGNYDVHIDWSKNDEFGTLARSFYAMSRKLASNQDEMMTLNSNMKFMAFHDPLTHLGNRRYGQTKLDELIRYSRRKIGLCGIMSIDLDNFKTINDTLGHDIGDEMLIHVSEMMGHSINTNDMIFRFGGDEFILLFKDVPTMDLVEKLSERIVRAVSTPLEMRNRSIYSSCSIGVVVIDDEIKKAEQLLKRADIAMYSAKQNGGNRYIRYKSII